MLVYTLQIVQKRMERAFWFLDVFVKEISLSIQGICATVFAGLLYLINYQMKSHHSKNDMIHDKLYIHNILLILRTLKGNFIATIKETNVHNIS